MYPGSTSHTSLHLSFFPSLILNAYHFIRPDSGEAGGSLLGHKEMNYHCYFSSRCLPPQLRSLRELLKLTCVPVHPTQRLQSYKCLFVYFKLISYLCVYLQVSFISNYFNWCIFFVIAWICRGYYLFMLLFIFICLCMFNSVFIASTKTYNMTVVYLTLLLTLLFSVLLCLFLFYLNTFNSFYFGLFVCWETF